MIATADDRDRIGPYRVLKAIGAGGSARIDLARIDRAYNFQRHVVLKRPLEHLREDPKALASLRREARLGGMLRHPNLVALLDAGTHDHYDYLVLEFIHGASLRTAMQTGVPGRVAEVPLAVALAIIIDTARGLHAAHELTDDAGVSLGLVHRDVSPGNVLLGLDGAVKLADFGIAKETRVTTLSGSLHGTVTYMAPEQCRGHAFDRRADIFSLGVILYELVTGTRLFWADNDVASLHRVLSGQVPPPRSVRPELPPALEAIVMTALAPDPAHRFATACELAGALERFAADHGEPLAARFIARWMHDLLGPREVPWFGSTTQVDVPINPGEGSLIDIIAATPDDLAPRAEGFGPGDVALVEVPADALGRAGVVRRGVGRDEMAPGVLGGHIGRGDLARGRGDLGRGDIGRGDIGRRDLARGDLARGDLARGDNARDDNARGDVGRGDVGRGDIGRGALARGDNARSTVGARRRVWLSALVAGGLIGVGVLAFNAATTAPTTSQATLPATSPATSPTTSPTAPTPSSSPTTAPPTASSAEATATTASSAKATSTSVSTSPSTSTRPDDMRRRKRTRERMKSTRASQAPTTAKAGSGSQTAPATPTRPTSTTSTTPKPTKPTKPTKSTNPTKPTTPGKAPTVEWDPTILLPTDRSGPKK